MSKHLLVLAAAAAMQSAAAMYSDPTDPEFLHKTMEVPLDDPMFRPLYKVTLPASTGAVCNDGSPYVYYLSSTQYFSGQTKWVAMLAGGAWCFDAYSCNERWNNQPQLMSSKNYTAQVGFGPAILSGNSTFNPHFWDWNFVFLPYCTSDDFSGNSPSNPTPWSFMGSKIVPAVFNDLKDRGTIDVPGATIVLGGSSAGAEGVLPNLDRLASMFPQAQVMGLLDSGWFLDSTPYYSHPCKDAGSCTEQAGLMLGVPLWNSVMDSTCAAAKTSTTLWQCLIAYKAAPYISTPTLSLNWAFDKAQLGHDGIGVNPANGPSAVLQYARQSAYNLTQSFYNQQSWVYTSAACYCHTTTFNAAGWMYLKIGGAWLQDIVKEFLINPKKPANFIDMCDTPGCNPTCPQVC